MLNDQVTVLVAIAVLLLFGGLLLWAHFKRKRREARFPLTWIHDGVPPPAGIEIALDVIGRSTPGMPQAGYITWVEGPFKLDGRSVAGTVISERPIHIKLTKFERPEDTALAHELGHVWSYFADQGFKESPADGRFVEWFTSVNRQIAKALGR